MALTDRDLLFLTMVFFYCFSLGLAGIIGYHIGQWRRQ